MDGRTIVFRGLGAQKDWSEEPPEIGPRKLHERYLFERYSRRCSFNDLRQRRSQTPIVEAAHKFLVLSAMAILRQQRLFEPSSVLGFRFLLV
jgi:hypothetical protein